MGTGGAAGTGAAVRPEAGAGSAAGAGAGCSTNTVRGACAGACCTTGTGALMVWPAGVARAQGRVRWSGRRQLLRGRGAGAAWLGMTGALAGAGPLIDRRADADGQRNHQGDNADHEDRRQRAADEQERLAALVLVERLGFGLRLELVGIRERVGVASARGADRMPAICVAAPASSG